MGGAAFAIPQLENHGRALEASSFVSLLLHGLLLGALSFANPAPVPKPQAEETVSIDLALVAEAAPEPQAVAVAVQEPTPPEPEPAPVAPEPAPEPAPAPKKAAPPKPAPERRKAEKKPQQIAKPGKLVATATPGAAQTQAPARPAAKPATSPAPLGGASSPHPAYPELARKRGQEGTVNVRCQVEADGRVAAVALAKSSGFKLLDDAALKAVSKWKFRAGTRDGANVAGTVVVPVQFKLK